MYRILHYLDRHGKDHYQDWLLRVDVGAGYRIYYAFAGRAVILLTCGENKQSQDHDIASAIEMLRDWKIRHEKAPPFS